MLIYFTAAALAVVAGVMFIIAMENGRTEQEKAEARPRRPMEQSR